LTFNILLFNFYCNCFDILFRFRLWRQNNNSGKSKQIRSSAIKQQGIHDRQHRKSLHNIYDHWLLQVYINMFKEWLFSHNKEARYFKFKHKTWYYSTLYLLFKDSNNQVNIYDITIIRFQKLLQVMINNDNCWYGLHLMESLNSFNRRHKHCNFHSLLKTSIHLS